MAAEPLQFVPASSGSLAAFVAILVAVVMAVLAGIFIAYRRTEPGRALAKSLTLSLLVGLWLGMVAGVVQSGTLQNLPFNGLPFFFAGVLAVSILAGLSPAARRMAHALPLAALVGFQAFRLPLELVLHDWSGSGTIPETMTWTGKNWDIVSGIVALLAAPLANRRRGVAWGANIVGIVLLANVIRVAVLSSPLPIGWNVSPPLLLALHLPYALIGPVCVGGALAGHLVLTRALLARPAV
jgi:hypothetical protein